MKETGKKTIPSGPWKVTGISKRAPHIKVRGTALGQRWAMANIPFVVDGERFYDVEEAEIIAKAVARVPDMVGLLQDVLKEATEDTERTRQIRAILNEINAIP